MHINGALDILEEQKWLENASSAVQKAVAEAFKAGGDPAKVLKDLLHGTALGHPLHPIMTDVAIGGYTVAWFLDILGKITDNDRYRDGADQALVVGMIGALGSVLTGIADWSDTDGKARNLGMVHAITNVTANALYVAAWLNRKSNRGLRFWLSMAGATVLTAGAYLGGHLVFSEQIGVDHTKGQPFPEKFTPVMAASELRENKLTRKEVGGAKILLLKHAENVYALSEVCSHLGGPLAEGTFDAENCSVTCPWHGSTFSLEDGSVLTGPTTHPAPCFKTRIRNGQIEIKLNRQA